MNDGLVTIVKARAFNTPLLPRNQAPLSCTAGAAPVYVPANALALNHSLECGPRIR